MSPNKTGSSLAEKQAQALNLFLQDLSGRSRSKTNNGAATTTAPAYTAPTPLARLDGSSSTVSPSASVPSLAVSPRDPFEALSTRVITRAGATKYRALASSPPGLSSAAEVKRAPYASRISLPALGPLRTVITSQHPSSNSAAISPATLEALSSLEGLGNTFTTRRLVATSSVATPAVPDTPILPAPHGIRPPTVPRRDDKQAKLLGILPKYDIQEDGDEDGSGSENEGVTRWLTNEAPRKPRKITERKRADAAAFDVWVETHQKALTDDSQPAPEKERSLAWKVTDDGSYKIIDSPFDYQIELFERAKKQNTIAVLGTGSGKTLIAALLIRWTIEQELEDRAVGKSRRVTFFLVDKVALVFQQYDVLTESLDYPCARFCGELDDSLWNQEHWDKAFAENEVIVCTAAILYKCLHHSYIQMDQISLLVFDEAHHTKNKHPYARIIKDFYAEATGKDRFPRIFGMTASPVDGSRDDMYKAATELEGLLHSQIVTPANPNDLRGKMSKPKTEIDVEYPRHLPEWETRLFQSLKPLLEKNKVFNKALAFTKWATAELGQWCADRFWLLWLREDDLPKFEAKTEKNFLKFMPEGEDADTSIDQVRAARRIIARYQLPDVTLENYGNMVSGKVATLIDLLQDKFGGAGSKSRCIVFVERRWVSMMLNDLFRQPGMAIPGLRPEILVGSGSSDTSYKTVSYKDQKWTIHKFRKGEKNCLFATSVAEEGLDIPDCNIVIRFDLYNTMIQYIQSRGRARHADSEYIRLIESGNAEHQRRVDQNKSHETTLRVFCEALPEDRKLSGNDFEMEYFLRKEKGQKKYTVPETGATLTYSSALGCLANFASLLPMPAGSSGEAQLPSYSVIGAPGGFQCEVIMPESSPISNAMGKTHTSKQAAKCSAAFEMCLKLYEKKYLNSHLQSVYVKQLPLMRNAHLAISSKKKEEYEMRTKPELWSDLGVPDRLYITVLTLETPQAFDWPSRPLLLLTRAPLPPMVSFPLYFSQDRSSHARCLSMSSSIAIDDDVLAKLHVFTLRVFQEVFSKEYDAIPSQLPYFLAPANHGHEFAYRSASNQPHDLVDWDSLDFVQNTDKIKWTGTETQEFFDGKFVSDPWDGSRKVFVVRRRDDMKPTDLVPEGVPPPSHRAWNRVPMAERNILNYSVSLWSKSRAKINNWRQDQPVFEIMILSTRRNLLDDNLEGEQTLWTTGFVVLEPLNVSALPPGVVAMTYLFPATIFKIESCLIALDACKLLDLTIRPDLALEAVTKDSDNTEEHDVDQVNFQGGMGNNYERLEFLGDTFLKMGTTISLFTLNPDNDEFESHCERMTIICNKNLFNNALEVKLQEYIRSKALSRRTWYPEGLTLKRGKRTTTKNIHVLADKTIADVCEALIGAAYLTAREEGNFDMAVKAVTAMVKDKKRHPMSNWAEYFASYKMPEWQTAAVTTVQKDLVKKVSARTGYTFKYPRLLRCAFMHPSYPSRSYEKLPSYQRLEFLGDALHDMVCVEYLFHRYPGADPQWLTEHKMAMVSNKFLGCLSVELNFHKNMVSFSSAIQKEISTYVEELAMARQEAEEEAVRDGKDRSEYSRSYWDSCRTAPKCLPDVVESYIGAIFVDSGYDYAVVQDFFNTKVLPYFQDMTVYDSFARSHPVTRLTQLLQEKFHCTDSRILLKEFAPGSTARGEDDGEADARELHDLATNVKRVIAAVRLHGQTLVHDVCQSGRYAKERAAKKALAELEGLDLATFKAKYGCDCRVPDKQ